MPRPLRTVAQLVSVVALAGGTVVLGVVPAAATITCTQDWRPASPAASLNPDGSPTNPPRLLPPAPDADSAAQHLFCGRR